MATHQLVQVNVVDVASLPTGSEARIYNQSLAELGFYKIRNSYTYSVQMAAWCLALSKSFGRNAGWTDTQLLREVRKALLLLERAIRRAYPAARAEHRLFFSMCLAKMCKTMRNAVKSDIDDPVKNVLWLLAEGDREGPTHWYQNYVVTIRLLVGDDMGKEREITRESTTVLNMFIPANHVTWLIEEGLDPSKSDLYRWLDNGYLIKISWWETIPAPLPGSMEEILLEVHPRNWPDQPTHVIRPISTSDCVECEFYALHNALPFTLWLPVLEGGWIIPGHYKELLEQHGFQENVDTVIVFGEPRRTKALKVTKLSEPAAVATSPMRALLFVWRALCANCYQEDARESYDSISHFC